MFCLSLAGLLLMFVLFYQVFRYHCLRPFSFLFLYFFVSFKMSLFPSMFVPLPFSLLYREYVVDIFLPDGVFQPCDTGWIFYIALYENSINQYKLDDVLVLVFSW